MFNLTHLEAQPWNRVGVLGAEALLGVGGFAQLGLVYLASTGLRATYN